MSKKSIFVILSLAASLVISSPLSALADTTENTITMEIAVPIFLSGVRLTVETEEPLQYW